MADEPKKAKKAKAEKASGEKATGKKAAPKKDAAKAPKKAAAKKKAGTEAAKKPTAKKEAGAKKANAEKAAGKAEKAEKGLRKGAKKAPAGKTAPQAEAAVPVVRASARYVRIAPRKARLIADQVRGLHIEKARALLQFSPRGAARDIHKLIDSAAANAENNHDLVGDEMRISSITVDEGPTLRRYRPRALGRATPINKRTSHIAVALTPSDE
jgi:ribosomal protein L22